MSGKSTYFDIVTAGNGSEQTDAHTVHTRQHRLGLPLVWGVEGA